MRTPICAALVLGALLATPAITVAATPQHAGTRYGELSRHEVTFTGAGGLPLHGTITAPAHPRGRLPAIVLVHGSGTGKRGSHAAEAASFARDGIVTLTYDKRTIGYEQTSTGYQRLATDALAGLHLLQRQSTVDPERAGLWGLSEGGWVVPLAAARCPDVAFVVLVGASALPPRRQQEWNERTDLAHAGVSGSVVHAKADQLAKLGASLPSVPRADHDPLPPLRRLHQPVLAIWAAQDRVVPPAESARLLRRALDDGGNRRYTLRFVPGAEHTLHRSPDGFTELAAPVSAYLHLVGDWVHHLPRRPSADPLPAQHTRSSPVAAPSWWETIWVQGGVAIALILVFLSYPLLALLRRPRGRHPAAALLAGAGLLASAGTAGYLYYLIDADADELGPLLAGRPLPWLALQLLAVLVVPATLAVAAGVVRGRGDRGRLGVLLAGGLLFVPFALTWGLLLP